MNDRNDYTKLENLLSIINRTLGQPGCKVDSNWFDALDIRQDENGKYSTRSLRLTNSGRDDMDKVDDSEDVIIEYILHELARSQSFHFKEPEKYLEFDATEKEGFASYVDLFDELYEAAYGKKPDLSVYNNYGISVPPLENEDTIVFTGHVPERMIFESRGMTEDEYLRYLFEEETGQKFDPERYEIVKNYDAEDDGYDNPISTFSVVEHSNRKEFEPEKPGPEEPEKPGPEEPEKPGPEEPEKPGPEEPEKPGPEEPEKLGSEEPEKPGPEEPEKPGPEEPEKPGPEEPEKPEPDPGPVSDEEEVVVKTTPWQWVKDHKKQILIVLGLAAMAVSLYLVVTHLMPMLIAANNAQMVSNSLAIMSKNAAQWHGAAPAVKAALHSSSEALAANVSAMTGLDTIFTSSTGVWTIGGKTLAEATTAAATAATKTAAAASGLTTGALATGLGGLGGLGAGLLLKESSEKYKEMVGKITKIREQIETMSDAEFAMAVKGLLDEAESKELSNSERKELQRKLRRVVQKRKKIHNKKYDPLADMVAEEGKEEVESAAKGR